jgi:hypothetical protein
MAQSSQDEPLDDLYADLGFRLVTRFSDAGGDDGDLVMLSQSGVGGVNIGFVAAGLGNATL